MYRGIRSRCRSPVGPAAPVETEESHARRAAARRSGLLHRRNPLPRRRCQRIRHTARRHHPDALLELAGAAPAARTAVGTAPRSHIGQSLRKEQAAMSSAADSTPQVDGLAGLMLSVPRAVVSPKPPPQPAPASDIL